MGTMQHIGDLIDEHSLYVDTVEVDAENNSVLVTTREKRGQEAFSMMRGVCTQIVRQTGMVLSAVDTTAGREGEAKVWFSKAQIGVRDLS